MKRPHVPFRSLCAGVLCTVAFGLGARGAGAADAAFDRASWMRDYESLQIHLEQTYANLAWFASPQGGRDLAAIDRQAREALAAAHDDRSARAAITEFIDAFDDGHFSIVADPAPMAPSPIVPLTPPLRNADARTACAALGYSSAHGYGFSTPFEAMPGLRLLTDGAAAPYRSGIVRAGAGDIADWLTRLFTGGPVRSAPLGLVRSAASTAYFDDQLDGLRGAQRQRLSAADRTAVEAAIGNYTSLRREATSAVRGRSAATSSSATRTSGASAYLPPGAIASLDAAKAIYWPAIAWPYVGAWSGPVYVVIDDRSYSAAELMAAVFADNRIAPLVGERTGGDGCGFMYTSTYTLPSQRMRVRIPNCVRLRRDGADEVAGIAPDKLLPPYAGEPPAQHAARILDFIAADLAAAGTPSAASGCPATAPLGTFTGSAISKQAGKLTVTLTLTCADGRYGGSFVTPVGPFTITGGKFAGATLTLQFAAAGATGTLVAQASQHRIDGTFTLGADSGPVTLASSSGKEPPLVPTVHLSVAQRRADLADLAQSLPALHPQPFRFIAHPAFAADVTRLDRQIPRLNGDAVYFGLNRLANALGDAHTYVELPPDDANLPLDIQSFGPTYRVVDAAPQYAGALGARVLDIAGMPVGLVRERLLAITPAPETMFLRQSRVEGFMTVGMMLRGAAIAPQREAVTYTLQRDGGPPFNVTVHAIAPGHDVRYLYAWRTTPLHASRPHEGFWFVYLPEHRTVYCRFRSYDGLAQHAVALLRLVRRTQAPKLIVDMRGNGGGDYNVGLNDLLLPIAALPQINRRGRLFVLVDQDTFSAAMANAAQFRTYTKALLVGGVIGERPNSYQEPRQFQLPNSGLVVRYSTRFYAFAPTGPNEIVPDKIAVPTWAQFAAGADPALNWALAFMGSSSLSVEIETAPSR